MNARRLILLLATLLCCVAVPVMGQTTGSIAGEVKDEKQAVITGATVTVRNVQTNDTRTTQTNTEGRYRFVNMSVGDYEVAATYHAAKNPKPSATDHSDGLWHHDKEKDFAEVSKDPESWARNEILGALRRDEERMKGWR